MGSVVSICHHRICRDNYAALARKLFIPVGIVQVIIEQTDLFFLISGEDGDLPVGHIRPLHKLLLPLHNRHAISKEAGQKQKEKDLDQLTRMCIEQDKIS